MTHADMQLCLLEGELQKVLKHTPQPAVANVLEEPAAFAFITHRSLVDMTRTEPILNRRKDSYASKVNFE